MCWFLEVGVDDVEDGGLYPDGSVMVGYRAWAPAVVLDAGFPELPALCATEGGDLLVGGGDPASGNVGTVGCPLSVTGVVVCAVFVATRRAMAARPVFTWAHGQYGWY